jgi:hypothetical protein
MNILWVEDFGGGLKPSEVVGYIFEDVISNLSELIPDERTFDLKEYPDRLTTLVSDAHDFHAIKLCRHYGDFNTYSTSIEMLQAIDIVLLDLNLTELVDLDESEDIPEHYSPERGGLWIYNYLILKGFPKDNICILTGENSTLNNFREQCKAILMPEFPASFEKRPTEYEESEEGFEGLRNWLSSKEKTPYLQLRRGIISGCQFIRECIKTSSIASIQFKNFLNKKPTDNELKVSLLDYLETLEKFFPATEPVSKTRTYKLFLRTLAHEWETNANSNTLQPESDRQNTCLSSFGWIMKNLRNWMAHNVLTDNFTEQDVAFLFITAMRCMFKLPDDVQRYEWALFSLFDPIEKDEMERLLSAREIPLAATYSEVQKNLLDKLKSRSLKELKEHSSFNELLNTFQQNKGSYNYNVGLYQIYWLTLPKMETNFGPISITNHTASFNTTYEFNETNSYGIDDWKVNEKHFLFHFSRHIYKNSFP